jgi:hypothetical protein
MGAGGNPVAQIVKLGHKAIALNMAAELHPHGVAAVAITPGFLRSESMLDHFGVTEQNWREGGAKDRNFLQSESPLYVGRAVVALAQDPKLLQRSGQLYSSWELAREFKFTDADGTRPDWGKTKIDFSQLPPDFIDYLRTGVRIQLEWLTTVARRTKEFVKQLPAPAKRTAQTAKPAKQRPSRARRRPRST